MANPMQQFEIKSLVELPQLAGHNVDFTNSSLFMVLAASAIVMFLSLSIRGRALVPNAWQSMGGAVLHLRCGHGERHGRR